MVRPGVGVSLLMTVCAGLAQAQPPGRRADSPAASPVPETVTEQVYAPELVEQGRALFGSQCAFCHGLDTAGGSGGADLTRSELVAEDVRGDRIEAVVRAGRPDADVPMPAFPVMAESDLAAIVAYIHEQKSRAETAEGGRRSVSVEDLASGNARAGRRYFEANCMQCHAAGGDLAGIASRMNGFRLLQTMLYPRRRGPGPSDRAAPTVTVTTADGSRFSGTLTYQDEFTVALTDAADGHYRSFSTRRVDYEIDDPLDGHLELLDRLSDRDMHDVLAYLHTLR
jgi:cytochrome c oxidase cbb3-type subunit 3